MGIIVDTSVIVDYLCRSDKAQSFFVSLLKEEKELCASIVTHTEAYSGKSVWERQEMREAIKEIFSGIALLPYDLGISEDAGKLRAQYNMEFVDAIIAATALRHTFPLATLNRKDFEGIEGLELLPL